MDSWFIRRRTSGRRLAKRKPSKSHENQVHRLTPPCRRLWLGRPSSAGCNRTSHQASGDDTCSQASSRSARPYAAPGSASYNGKATGQYSNDTAASPATGSASAESDAALSYPANTS